MAILHILDSYIPCAKTPHPSPLPLEIIELSVTAVDKLFLMMRQKQLYDKLSQN
jgi:hypothetical protein